MTLNSDNLMAPDSLLTDTGTTAGSVSPMDERLRRDFRDAVSIVDASGAVEALDDALVNVDPHSGKPIGRARVVTPRAVFVAGIVTFLQDRPGDVTSITRTLNDLPQDLLEELGLFPAIAPGEVPAGKVSYMWNRMTEVCNPSPIRAGKRLDIDMDGNTSNAFGAKQIDAKYLRPDLADDELSTKARRAVINRGAPRYLDDEERARRQTRLDLVSDHLLQATIPTELALGRWAVDWTDFESRALSYRNAKPTKLGKTSADPDAAWGRRRTRGNRIAGRLRCPSDRDGAHDAQTGDNAFEGDKSERFFGYNAHFATTTPAEDGSAMPEIAACLRLTAANDMAAAAPILVAMADSIADAGLAITKVYIDRGYSMRTTDSWLVPLSDRGIWAAYDLSKEMLGRQGSYEGAVLIGGELHCPQTPDELTNEAVPGPKATRGDWAEYWRRRDMLDQYAFRRLGRPGPDLNQRVQCPAYAEKCRCELQKQSMSIRAGKDIPEIYEPPENPPRCCTTPNLSLKRTVGLGSRQQHPHGSRQWVADYEARTAVERYNASVKFEQRLGRGDVRVLGLASWTLMLTMAAVSTNIRHLRNWQEATGRSVSVLAPDMAGAAEPDVAA
ncbi:MAG: hypothetical protein ABIS21_00835 [Acidimicrobiales bacterium]